MLAYLLEIIYKKLYKKWKFNNPPKKQKLNLIYFTQKVRWGGVLLKNELDL